MKLSVVAGTVSKTINVFIQDSLSTTGAGLTGLVFNSAGLTAYYALQRAVATVITLATQTVTGGFSAGGFVQIDATNMPGWYRLDVPNEALASGTFSSIHLKGATNMAPLPIEIELTGWNNQDGVRGGMTALPNATVSGVGGLLTAPTTANTGLSDVTRYGGTAGTFAAGRPEVNTSHWAGSAITATSLPVATAAGAAGGLLISGSNAGTTTFAALTVTGAMTLSDGLAITRSSANTSAITATGNGTGNGAVFTSGAGVTGDGIQATAGSTNGNGFVLTKTGTGLALKGATTDLVLAKTTNITGLNDIAATAVVSSGAITTSGGAVTTATNVTTVNGLAANVITAASIAADAITAAKIADNAIDRATFAADTGLQSVRSNTAQAGGGTSITLDAGASATTDFYKNALIVLTGGTGIGQGRYCTAYNGTTKVATVAAWATNPDVTSTFAIIAADAIVGATAPTAAAVATAVWQDLTAGSDFTTPASIGKLLVDNVNATVSSRMATYTQPTGFLAATFPGGTIANTTNITAGTITTATNLTNLPSIPANWLTAAGMDATAGDEIADAILGRNVSGGSSTGRTVKQALHFIRNKWTVSAGTLTVYDTDDLTSSWTGAVTGTAGADPITGLDP